MNSLLNDEFCRKIFLYILRWLKNEDVYTEYISNASHIRYDYLYDSIMTYKNTPCIRVADIINWSFDWSRTKQGMFFWQRQYLKATNKYIKI